MDVFVDAMPLWVGTSDSVHCRTVVRSPLSLPIVSCLAEGRWLCLVSVFPQCYANMSPVSAIANSV